jgi:hypothetical protein
MENKKINFTEIHTKHRKKSSMVLTITPKSRYLLILIYTIILNLTLKNFNKGRLIFYRAFINKLLFKIYKYTRYSSNIFRTAQYPNKHILKH